MFTGKKKNLIRKPARDALFDLGSVKQAVRLLMLYQGKYKQGAAIKPMLFKPNNRSSTNKKIQQLLETK